jgi:hypothetical protein
MGYHLLELRSEYVNTIRVSHKADAFRRPPLFLILRPCLCERPGEPSMTQPAATEEPIFIAEGVLVQFTLSVGYRRMQIRKLYMKPCNSLHITLSPWQLYPYIHMPKAYIMVTAEISLDVEAAPYADVISDS